MKDKNLFYSMAAALLLAAGLGSCSGDDEVVMPVENNKVVTLTATLGAKNGDATRALAADGKTTTWAVGEKIAVYYQQEGGSYATDTATVKSVDETTKKATIEASLTNPKSGTVKLVYPALLANTEGGIDKSKLLANQKGTTADISANWDAATNDGVTMTVNDGTASLPDDIALENQLCIVKYTLKDADGNLIEAKPLVISVGEDSYTVTPEEAASELYVAMLPVSGAEVSFTATVGSNTYAKTYTGITLVRGKFYSNATVKLAKEDFEFVDLGLSVKWANMNVGATSETDYGDYYAWGETTPHADNDYSQSKYTYTGDSDPLPLENDAAYAWNNECRMPTKAEFDELLNNTTREWKENYNGSGINGILLTSTKDGYTDKSIFLPAAGYRDGTSLGSQGSGGYYWSSSYYSSSNAWGLFFNSGYAYTYNDVRYCGQSVRPVRRSASEMAADAPSSGVALASASSEVGMVVGSDGLAYATDATLPPGVYVTGGRKVVVK